MKSISIIPEPNSIELLQGEFVFDSSVKIAAADGCGDAAECLTEAAGQLSPQINDGGRCIELVIDSAIKSQEGYKLEINPEYIRIAASQAAGLFYGVQTLLQMMTEPQDGQCKIPCAVITDQPRFKWRGLHIDVARHFMPIEFLEKLIDLLAMHKMNVLHLHLTEDQGWRIEIKKYPRLTEIGAWRDATLIGHKDNEPHKFDGIKHGGFYTQKQLRELVQYAAKRHITIVPEIGMPGHALAALASYPQYSCTGTAHSVQKSWGVFDDIYCAGNDETFTFLTDILDEVLEIFPSKYIHTGGDEAPKKRWQSCPKCQKRIAEEGLKDEDSLQSWFVCRIEKHLNSKGRMLIGWDEILEGGLAPNAAVMSWRGEKGGIEAANAGHKVVMSPTDYCYLDYYQSADKQNEPLAIGGLLTLEKTYSYEPITEKISKENQKFILGVQGNIWTEYMKTPSDVEYMTFPRACAIAETAWTQPQNKNETDFKNRLKAHLKRLDKMNVNYRSLNP